MSVHPLAIQPQRLVGAGQRKFYEGVQIVTSLRRLASTKGTGYMDDQLDQIAALFRETAAAHHQAYIETDGDDPEWPLWYAEYMRNKLAALLDAKFTKSELVYLLVRLDKEQQLEAPGANWPRYYADWLVGNYG
ncbi:MAG: hypothetical protein GYB67_02655 [Chloroflexi bacterium]|nr:hypothetical protein [Chloroflexota bacterium]